jgi:iron-sulfur cluster assembly protein
MITATQAAIDKLKALREGDKALRVSVAGGGCSGLSYKLEWIDPATVTGHDKLFVVGDDIKVVVDPKSHLYLSGTSLDYTDGLDGVGFTFNNPNAKRSCGCGESFSV